MEIQANESPLYVYLSVTDRKTSRKMNLGQKYQAVFLCFM